MNKLPLRNNDIYLVLCSAPLYRFVYRGMFSFVLAFLLCVGFLLLEVQTVFASELTDIDKATEIVVDDPAHTDEISPIAEKGFVEEDSQVEDDVTATGDEEKIDTLSKTVPYANDITDDVGSNFDAVIISTGDENEFLASTPSTTSNTDVSFDDDTAVSSVEEYEIDFDTASNSLSEYVSDNAMMVVADDSNSTTTGEEVISYHTPEVISSSTELNSVEDIHNDEIYIDYEESYEEIVESVSFNPQDNAHLYQFNKTECVLVADGSYYCTPHATTDASALDADRVFANVDSSGYANIYVQRNGTVSALTQNLFDEGAPYYDTVSESVVWHRLVDDRYQIVSYDIRTQGEYVLTDTLTNNMQPVKSGDVIAWQRWVDNNWEIIIYEDGEERQITNNTVHDIAPSINDGFLIWNTSSPTGTRQVGVYEISTGLTSVIDDPEGGYISNPRFVLVYDTRFDNGDVITKGFNPETGEIVPLASVPGDRAPNIPSPDPVGEARALIQNKSQSNKENILETAPPRAASGTDMTVSTSTEEQLLSEDVLLSTDQISEQNEPSIIEDVNLRTSADLGLELTEYDVVILPFEEAHTHATSLTAE